MATTHRKKAAPHIASTAAAKKVTNKTAEHKLLKKTPASKKATVKKAKAQGPNYIKGRWSADEETRLLAASTEEIARTGRDADNVDWWRITREAGSGRNPHANYVHYKWWTWVIKNDLDPRLPRSHAAILAARGDPDESYPRPAGAPPPPPNRRTNASGVVLRLKKHSQGQLKKIRDRDEGEGAVGEDGSGEDSSSGDEDQPSSDDGASGSDDEDPPAQASTKSTAKKGVTATQKRRKGIFAGVYV